MQQEIDAGAQRGCLMRTYTLAYPTMRRVNFLYTAFSQTMQRCLQSGRQPLSKVSPPRPGRPSSQKRRSSAKALEDLPGRVSQAAMDTLYSELLQLDQAAGRCVLSGIAPRRCAWRCGPSKDDPAPWRMWPCCPSCKRMRSERFVWFRVKGSALACGSVCLRGRLLRLHGANTYI